MRLYSVLPYLLLVSFMSGTATTFTGEMAHTVRGSHYNGVAVIYSDACSCDAVDEAVRKKEFARIAGESGKEVWPWVFLNRMVGYVPGKGITTRASVPDNFLKVKGMDLFDETGDRSGFIDVWRGALRTARATGAPGVVLDLEAYNNYDCYDVGYLAGVTGRDKESVRAALRSLGTEMADTVAQEYPAAVVWTLFTAVDRKRDGLDGQGKDFMSFAYVTLGMLERCIEKGYGFEVVSGGEWGLWYCSKDLDGLKEKIVKRDASFKEALARYPNLRLGGTIAPWPAAGLREGWMLEGECAGCGVLGAEGFVPYLSELMRSYSYVWVYAASKAGYRPYDAGCAARMDRVAGAALEQDGGGGQR